MVFEVLHPPLLPVTVYTVATVGLTITEVPVIAPGFHVYDAAPLPVRVAELPIHTAVAVAEAFLHCRAGPCAARLPGRLRQLHLRE